MAQKIDYTSLCQDSEAIVILERNYMKQAVEFNDYDSLMFVASQHSSVRNIIYHDYEYKLNPDSKGAINITDDISFEYIKSDMDEKSGITRSATVKLSSNTLDVKEILKFISNCKNQYIEHKKSGLGDNLYYFDQIHINDPNFKKDVMVFTKKIFASNKKFSNLFFEQKDEFVKRTLHFKNNKKWYDDRGMPYCYTYGAFGYSGCGKTSTMKAMATELNRHIINFKLDDNTTEPQFKHLMFDSNLYILNEETGKIDCCNIPIKNRFLILEDADTMNGIMTARNKDEYNPIRDKYKAANKIVEINDNMNHVNHINDMDEMDPKAMMLMDMAQEQEQEKRELNDELKKNKLTLHSLLTVIDGVMERTDQVMVIASQYFDKFDAAILRRLDIIIHYKKTNQKIIKEMIDAFFNIDVPIEKLKNIQEYKIPHVKVNQICFKNLYSDINEIIKELEFEANFTS